MEEAVSPYNFVGKLQDHQQKWAKQKNSASLKTFLKGDGDFDYRKGKRSLPIPLCVGLPVS